MSLSTDHVDDNVIGNHQSISETIDEDDSISSNENLMANEGNSQPDITNNIAVGDSITSTDENDENSNVSAWIKYQPRLPLHSNSRFPSHPIKNEVYSTTSPTAETRSDVKVIRSAHAFSPNSLRSTSYTKSRINRAVVNNSPYISRSINKNNTNKSLKLGLPGEIDDTICMIESFQLSSETS